jgi:hypothetical protein
MVLSGCSTLDMGSGEWKLFSKYEVSYDAKGQVTMETRYSWDNDISDWTVYDKTEYTYNDNDSLTLEMVSQWNIDAADWIFDSRKNYYYSMHSVTPVPLVRENPVSVYPNPASAYFMVEMGDTPASAILRLYDSQGRQILERRILGRESIPVGTLAAGTYLYVITVADKTYYGKIVIH